MKARRLPVHDQITDGGESVVLVGDTVVRLSALATALLAEMTDWTESDQLAESMTRIFGPSPSGSDTRGLVEEAVKELAAQGIVEHA